MDMCKKSGSACYMHTASKSVHWFGLKAALKIVWTVLKVCELTLDTLLLLDPLLRWTDRYTALFHCSLWWRSWSVAYRGGGGLGCSNPPEIPKFWQSWAEFPVPWKIHPQQPNKNTAFTHFLSCFVKRPPCQLSHPHWYFFLSKAWRDISIVTEVWISAIRIPWRYSARYRWSPWSHEQEESASQFPFVVHFVLILL